MVMVSLGEWGLGGAPGTGKGGGVRLPGPRYLAYGYATHPRLDTLYPLYSPHPTPRWYHLFNMYNLYFIQVGTGG
jgi:hypothetical protein